MFNHKTPLMHVLQRDRKVLGSNQVRPCYNVKCARCRFCNTSRNSFARRPITSVDHLASPRRHIRLSHSAQRDDCSPFMGVVLDRLSVRGILQNGETT